MTALMLTLLGAAPDAALLGKIGARALQMEKFANSSRVTIEFHDDKLDGDGKVTRTTRTRVRVGRSGETVESELLAYEEDGKDLTESKRAEQDAKRSKANKEPKSFAVKSPFHPDLQSKYEFAFLTPPANHPQLLRIGFKPAGEKTSELYMGEATVDPETGDLLNFSLRPSKNPTMVQSLFIDATLDAQTPSGRAISKLTMQVVAGVLFIKERHRVTTTFTDYEPF